MSKARELLLLHLSQAEVALDRAKNNSYSDEQKQQYQRKLEALFEAVKADSENRMSSLNDSDIYNGYRNHLNFIFKSLEFLDSSTLNQIPYEIVECLKYAMDDWLQTSDKYIIVTSLVNDFENFSFDPWVAFDYSLYFDIEASYGGLDFPHKLVQINLPQAFSRDYLALVVLYHELGHFIDMRFRLMDGLTSEVVKRVNQNTFNIAELSELKVYLPNLKDYILHPHPPPILSTSTQAFEATMNHFSEYFCDLFAAQYIGDAVNHYITYGTANQNRSSFTHPSTVERVKVVNDFLVGQDNIIVRLIGEAIFKICSTTLQKRYSTVSSNEFYSLVPPQLSSVSELHGVMAKGWHIWLHERDIMSSKLNSGDTTKIYKVLNNLIEKSIANYITSKKWKDACFAKGLGLPDIPEASTQSDIQQLANCLTKQDIVDLLHKKELVIRPLLASDQLGNVGIDFRLGQDFLVSIQGREPFINASKNYWLSGGANRDIFQFFQPTRRQIGETFILHPHQTVLAVSLEYIKVPDDCILLLFMRSSYSRLGITVSTMAQPGYTGCLSLELTNNNNNPVNLAIGARIIQGLFQRVSSSTAYFDSQRKYVCQVRPEPSAVIKDQDLSVLNHLWEASNNRVPSSITP